MIQTSDLAVSLVFSMIFFFLEGDGKWMIVLGLRPEGEYASDMHV